jgi:hypothetical protein
MKHLQLLGIVSVLALSACGDDNGTNTTPGFRVTLETRAELTNAPSFENAVGWQITLSKVYVSSGAIYYFDGSPIESAAISKPSSMSRLGFLNPFAPSVAYAHPGHYQEGEAKGEMLEATSFELVAGVATLATGEGTSGEFRSARFTFNAPPAGPMASALGSKVVVVEGTAAKGAMSKVFRLEGGEGDVLDAAKEPAIEGCTFDEADVQSDGVVTIHFDPEVWLDQAEFDTVEDSADGEPVLVPTDDSASKSFVRGIKKSSAITFSFTKS